MMFSKQTEDFVRAALDFCIMIEHANDAGKEEFVDNMCKILPLLYIKATVAPQAEEEFEPELESRVTELMYNRIEQKLADLMGEDNMFLETFHPDIQLSDSPVAVKISENLADIWQDLGNFIEIFKNGEKKTMSDSTTLCIINFKKFWGQKLVNVLRALHCIKYKSFLIMAMIALLFAACATPCGC
ncbi:MAG: DUF5063 domain-containing protein [Dysgonamonadaceae bacterium]|nr:DUF5063 domain-containing protein [Dysgonamonadaceae bacterium]